MRTQRNTMKGYKIDFATNTITMNYSFAKKAQDYGSPEYELMRKIKADFPMMTLVVEAGRKVTTTNSRKRLTYVNMKAHMDAYMNSDELIERFELAKKLSKPLASPYKYVCDWFRTQFPDYKDVVDSITNAQQNVALVDLPDTRNYKRKDGYYA